MITSADTNALLDWYRTGKRDGTLQGITTTLDALQAALDHGVTDVQAWLDATRGLWEATLPAPERSAEDRGRLVDMRDRFKAGQFDPKGIS